MNLQQIAAIAQILSLPFGAYCAYGVYIALHPPKAGQAVVMFNSTWLAIIFGAFATCLIVMFLAWLVSILKRLRTKGTVPVPLPAATVSVPPATQIQKAEDVHKDCIRATHPQMLTLQRTFYETHLNKVAFLITLTWAADIEIWAPLWESEEVRLNVSSSSLRMERRNGSWEQDAWDEPCACLHLSCGQTFKGSIDVLVPPIGEGFEVRLNGRNTGCLIFPIKIAGKLRFERIKI